MACSADSDCETDGFVGEQFCQNGDLYQDYIKHTCNNRDAADAHCSSNTRLRLKEECKYGCNNKKCNRLDEADLIQFRSLPPVIKTNINAFPITGKVSENTKAVYVNNVRTRIGELGSDFFRVVNLKKGKNTIKVRIVDDKGRKTTYSKQIEFSPQHSTENAELVYANVNYWLGRGWETEKSILVIDVKKGSFLGIIRNNRIKGITRNGSEIVLNDGKRYSTKNHSYIGKTLPNFDSSSKLIFSNDEQYVYYNNYKVNLNSNSIVGTLSERIGWRGDITKDDKKIIIRDGYINTESNTFVERGYSNGQMRYSGSIAIDPTAKYVLHSSCGDRGGKATLLSAEDAKIIKNYEYPFWVADDAGAIVFSPDGKKAYIGFFGNSIDGNGGITIIDMDTLEQDTYFKLYGAKSLAVSEDGKVYASAFYTRGYGRHYRGKPAVRGIVELVPADGGRTFEINKVYFANLVSTDTFSPSYGSIFYKQGRGVECNSNIECGTDRFTGSPFCQGNNVYQDYSIYMCNNPGAENALCSSSTEAQLKETCQYGCSQGKCNSQPSDLFLQCPSEEIGADHAFEWNNGEGYNRFYLQFGYYESFAKRTYTQIRAKESPMPITKYFKRLIKLESKSLDGKLYARIYAKGKRGLKGYSNVCEFKLKQPVTPTLACPQEPIGDSYAFEWSSGDFTKRAQLQFSYTDDFKRKTSLTAKTSPVPVAKKYRALTKYQTKSADGTLFARIYAKDKFGRKVYSEACQFEVQ